MTPWHVVTIAIGGAVAALGGLTGHVDAFMPLATLIVGGAFGHAQHGRGIRRHRKGDTVPENPH